MASHGGHGHSHGHEHGASSGQFRSSTLYNETGSIRLYRVSEETRKKVAEDTNRINQEMINHNIQSRRKLEKEENEKFRTREKFRKAMISRWVERYKGSPLSVDQLEIEENRKARVDEMTTQKRIYDRKVKIVASMKSEADNVYGRAAHAQDYKHHTKMALKYQQFILDDTLINSDHKILDKMLQDELENVALKFPVIAERSKMLSTNDEDDMDNSTGLDTEESSQGSQFAPNPYFKDRKKKTTQVKSSSVSTGFSGPLEYSSPDARMRELRDDLSEKFSETQLL